MSAGAHDPRLLALLDQAVSGHLSTDPEVVAAHSTDWSGRFVGRSDVVVRPGTTDEVAAVLSACRHHGAPLVPQGGNTGLVGGSVPLGGEIVLSTVRLDRLDPVDDRAGQVTAGAGTRIGDLQRAARRAGWAYGVDLASRESATVGGTVATDAGGLHVLRYGTTRAQVMGVEAVLGTGAVLSHLGGLAKDNTGYDLAGLLCGSEGTLGIVTAARLALVPPLDHRTVALLAFPSVAGAVAAATGLRRGLPDLHACELMVADGVALVCRTFSLRPPFAEAHPAVLLVEAAGTGDPTPSLARAVDSLDGVADAVVATDPGPRTALWRYREAHTDAVNTLGPPHKLDVALPVSALAEAVTAIPRVVHGADPDAAVWLFGHAGDGNIHVNVTGPAPDDERVDDAVFRLVAALGGSISAEHGIGTAKRRWLGLCRSADELATFSALRRSLDPDGVLNPAVLVAR